MREEMYAQAPGASTLQGRSGEQRGCRSSITPSKASLERKNRLFSKGSGGMIAHLRGKMEIPAGMKGLPASPKTHQLPTSRALLAKAF